MKLTVLERIHLLNLFPPVEGDLLTLRITRRLREALSFTEEEHELFKPVQEGNSVKWDATIEQNREVDISDKGRDLIAKAIKAASAKAEKGEPSPLKEAFVPLYDRFVPED